MRLILLGTLANLLACSGGGDEISPAATPGGAAGSAGAGPGGTSGQAGTGGAGQAGSGLAGSGLAGSGQAGAGAGGAGAGQGGEGGGSQGGGGGQPFECPSQLEQGVLSEEEAPISLVLDGEHAYWASATPSKGGYVHEIRRAPRGGGEAETVATAEGVVGAVALTSESVVWVEGASDGLGPSTLRRRIKAGGEATTVATFTSLQGQADLFSLQATETDAFVLLRQFGADFRYAAYRVSLESGKAKEIASHTLPAGIDARSMALDDDGELYWSFLSGWLYHAFSGANSSKKAALLLDTQDGIDGWALRGEHALYLSAGGLWQIPKAGGDKALLLDGAEGYRALAASPSWVAWGTRDHAGVEQIRGLAPGGQVCTLVAEGVVSAYTSVIDGDRFYWTNTASKKAGGSIRWVRLP